MSVLRDVVDADLLVFFEHQCDPEAAAMAAFPSRDRDAFRAHWAKIRADDATRQWTIVDDGAVAGNIGCWHDGEQALVGYWLGRAFWGRGLATRALRELLDIVQERPVHAYVAKHNAASIRVLEKCGFAEVEEHTGEGGVVELLFRIGPDRE